MDYLCSSAIIKTLLIAPLLMATLAYIVWVERKVIAHVQLRVGPYFVGPHGLLQPIADAVKLLTKEDFIPSGVNHFFYWAGAVAGVDVRGVGHCGHPVRPDGGHSGHEGEPGIGRYQHRPVCGCWAWAAWASTALRWPVGAPTTNTR